MKIIIFDLFGTLIDKDEYDYDKALRWLADTYFESKFLELKGLSQIFKKKYLEDRKKSNKETSFINQLTFFENELNIKIYNNLNLIELNFMYIFRKEKLIDNAIDVLKYLNENNYRVFILSNSIFSGVSLKMYLDYLGIGKYIEKVFSSADIGFRKPSKEIFSYIIEKLKIDRPQEVYFIGDSLEKDYDGSKKNGFIPILIGKDNEKLDLTFKTLSELLEYLKKIDNN